MARHAPALALLLVLANACGPKVGVEEGDADGDGSGDDPADDDADTRPGTSGGDDPLAMAHILAWIDAEQRLNVSVSNHALPTCDDPTAFPPTSDCEYGDPEVWTVRLMLAPPQTIPGTWEVDDNDALSSFFDTRGPECSSFGIGTGLPATLSLESFARPNLIGTVTIDAFDTGVVPFSVPMCP